ncbi:hypothetical protein LAD12857_10210 [Lacrimispora amygdalina]|uniref:DUF3784 domain-containing protein n=1 Tax=Lacrimispora amygdalina TaxID=253257 RepID=A0ABQ5M2D1_9FIRM
MIFSSLLFFILSECFCRPGLCRFLAGEKGLTHKEERIGHAFGSYLRADAFLLLLLWGLSFFPFPYLYQGIGVLFLIITFFYLKKMVIILMI